MSNGNRIDPQQDMAQVIDMAKKSGSSIIIIAVLAAVGFGIWSSYYEIQPDEVGLILRFGKHQPPDATPGLHFKIPFGVDQVIKVPVERQLKMEFGFRTQRAGVESKFSRDEHSRAEAKMLTADRNVAIVEWIIQYKIADAAKYLFNFRNIDTTLRLMAEATMRAVVGDYTVDELITGGREEIEQKGRERLRALNAFYDTGIMIQQLKLQDANVTDNVKPALREVEEAKQEKARAINLAEAQRNKVIPEARGSALEAIATAEGYQIARINEARGNARRFKMLLAEYRKAEDVTRTRLYFESLSKVLTKAERKFLVDKHTKNLVPLLNLSSGGGQ